MKGYSRRAVGEDGDVDKNATSIDSSALNDLIKSNEDD